MASSEGVGKGVKPASELTAEDLIRVFNDPDGELHHYDFVMKEEPAIGVSQIWVDVLDCETSFGKS